MSLTLLLPCLLLASTVACKKMLKTAASTDSTAPAASTASNTTLEDQELDLPPPSLLRSLYDTTLAVVEAPWSDSEAASRQGGGAGIGAGIRITLGAFFATLLATVFGVVGFGSVGLLAAKALAVGTLALFLTALGALKKSHKEDPTTVHYVPIQQPHTHHHDFYHERSDLLPPSTYLDRNM